MASLFQGTVDKAPFPAPSYHPSHVLFPYVLGAGDGVIEDMVELKGTVPFIILLLVGKFAFTMFSTGSGAPGGSLQPMLVLGAICGGLYGNLAAGLGLLPPEYRLHMVVFAMAGFFTGSVRAPVTGILLLLELTGRFYHMVPLGIVTLLPMLQVNCSAIGPSLTLFSKMTLRSASRKRPKRTSCSAIPMFMKLLWKAVPLLKAKA